MSGVESNGTQGANRPRLTPSIYIPYNPNDRRTFIGGSDARIIMGNDADRLILLWKEKRGEVDPEDLSDNLIVQLGSATEDLNRRWYERNTGQAVKSLQKRVQHPIIKWMAATLDGIVKPSGAVFEAKFMLPWTFTEAAEKHMAIAAQHVGYELPVRSAVNHHWWRQMGRDDHPC